MASWESIGLSIDARHRVAQKLALLHTQIIQAQVEEFDRLHPDWRIRYGEHGRILALKDAGCHIDFLAGAIESGTVEPFINYVMWCVRMFGARRISCQNVVEFMRILETVLMPLLAADEQELVKKYIEAGCVAVQNPKATIGPQSTASELALERELFLQTLLQGNRTAAWNIINEAIRAGADIRDIYLDVFQWSMYEIGRLWEENRICVAQEHMATAITQYIMVLTYQSMARSAESAGRMVIAGVQGELHQIGANMVADVLEADGWDIRFLGVNMPPIGILRAIEDHQAGVLGISTTVLSNLPNAIRLVQEAREAFGDALRFVLGGAAFRLSPGLIAELGAEGFATDLREARTLMSRLARR